MRHRELALSVLAGCVAFAAPALAQTTCVPGTKWVYAGTAKGSASVRDSGKATVLEFAPSGSNGPDSVVFTSINESGAGVYQVNADLDITHLSDDATIALEGATSAAAGRPFEVNLAAGDGGSSGFSRPINTTGKPFTVLIKMHAANRISFKVRNFVVCKIR